jgi:hypothetical protein
MWHTWLIAVNAWLSYFFLMLFFSYLNFFCYWLGFRTGGEHVGAQGESRLSRAHQGLRGQAQAEKGGDQKRSVFLLLNN